jgi:putative transposase
MKTGDILKKYKHNPPHLFLDNTYYMITSGTYKKLPHLRKDDDKKLLLEVIKESCEKFRWRLKDWVILNNHYHLMLKSFKGKDLKNLLGRIHRKSSNLLKRKNKIMSSRIWWNYWDTCIRGESDFFKRINYIYYNPVKHGYVADPVDYKWSSFEDFLGRNEEEKIKEQLQKYSFEDLRIEDDF